MLITSLKDGYNPNFFCYWLNSVAARYYFDVEAWGSAQPNISVPILKEIPVPIPPEQSQAAITAYLDHQTGRIDALVAEAQTAVALLHERRSALISAAVTGKIDVRGLVKDAVAA